MFPCWKLTINVQLESLVCDWPAVRNHDALSCRADTTSRPERKAESLKKRAHTLKAIELQYYVTAIFQRTRQYLQFQRWERLFTFTFAHRMKPCCSDQRDTSSALRSVPTKVWVEATPPPSDQYVPFSYNCNTHVYQRVVVLKAFKVK